MAYSIGKIVEKFYIQSRRFLELRPRLNLHPCQVS